jgi:hypothetical protein
MATREKGIKNGKKKRYRQKRKFKITKEHGRTALRLLFVPWGCLGVWFGIIAFCIMCFLTAFGFD